jgi:hypothetical protein
VRAYDTLAVLSEFARVHALVGAGAPSVIFFLAVFVLLGYAPAVLLLFGLIDLAGAA